jgi:hypothetical protein
MHSERVSSSCSTSGTRRVNLVKNKIKEVCLRLRLNIQICQSIAGCHQVIHQENDRSLVDKSECVPQMRVIIA